MAQRGRIETVTDVFFVPQTTNPTTEGQVRHDGVEDLVVYDNAEVKSLRKSGTVASLRNAVEASYDTDFWSEFNCYSTGANDNLYFQGAALASGTATGLISGTTNLCTGKNNGLLGTRCAIATNSGYTWTYTSNTNSNIRIGAGTEYKFRCVFAATSSNSAFMMRAGIVGTHSATAPTVGIWGELSGTTFIFKSGAGDIGTSISLSTDQFYIIDITTSSDGYSASCTLYGNSWNVIATRTTSTGIPTSAQNVYPAYVSFFSGASGSIQIINILDYIGFGTTNGYNAKKSTIYESIVPEHDSWSSCHFYATNLADGPMRPFILTSLGSSAGYQNTAPPAGAITGKNPGVLTIGPTSAVANSGLQVLLSKDPNSNICMGNGVAYRFRAIVYHQSFTNTVNRIGFFDVSTTNAPADGLYFDVANATVSCKAIKTGGTSTTASSTYTATTGIFYIYDIEVNAAGTSATFSISDNNNAELFSTTISTASSIPTTQNTPALLNAGIQTYVTTNVATNLICLDYMGVGTANAFAKEHRRFDGYVMHSSEIWQETHSILTTGYGEIPYVTTVIGSGQLTATTLASWAQIAPFHNTKTIRGGVGTPTGYAIAVNTGTGNFLLGQGVGYKIRAGFGVSSASSTKVVRFGTLNTTSSTDATNGVYFEINNTTASCKTANNSTRTTAGSTYTLSDNTFYIFDVEINAAATLATFTIFNALGNTQLFQTTISTNIPTAAANTHAPGLVAHIPSAGSGLDIAVIAHIGFGATVGWQTRRLAHKQYTTYPTPGAVPQALSTGQFSQDWLPDYWAILTDCGDGSDGDLVVTNTVTLSRDVRYKKVTFLSGGKIISQGWDFRAQIVDVRNASASCLQASIHSNGTAAAGAGSVPGSSSGNADHEARITLGGSYLGRDGGSGGISGTAIAGVSMGATASNGGRGGSGGTGGSGSLGPGAAGGTTTAVTNIFLDYDAFNITAWQTSTNGGTTTSVTDTIMTGNGPGAGGGGGRGDGSNAGGGGGCGGEGVRAGRWRIGKLITSSSTAAPIFECRGCRGGNGSTRTAGNVGGGGGGGGSGGGTAIVMIGTISGPSVSNAINATGGQGGNGGNGFGTGSGGNGGAGGNGGLIYYRRTDTKSTTLLNNSASAGSAGSAASGVTGGTGGAGLSTTLTI